MTYSSPFFSVIITTYNRANLILETIDTVLNQSYKRFEIIVVDDASTDNTQEILKPLVDSKKIKVVLNETNQERCVSRNNGLNIANGDFVTILDSDDFMYENNLKDAAEFIERNPKIHFFHNYFELVDDQRNSIYKYSFPKKNQFEKKLAEGNFISCIGNFLSREVYSKFKFSEDPMVLGSEDWEIWFRVMAEYKLGVIPKINSGVRNHADRSVNFLDYDKIINTKFYIINNLFKDDLINEKFGKFKLFMVSSVYLFAAVGANKYHQFKKARKYILKSLFAHPLILFTERFWRVFINSILSIKKNY